MAEDNRGKLTTATDVRDFALGGNATLTLVSTETGNRFTYRIRETPNEPDRPRGPVSHWVHVLTDPDNERGFTYLGNVFTKTTDAGTKIVDYSHGKKSRIAYDAPSARGIGWFFRKVIGQGLDPDAAKLECWHEGKCGRCGRKLTVPESIARGIGPECAAKNGRG